MAKNGQSLVGVESILAQANAAKDKADSISIVMTMKDGGVQTFVSEQTVGNVAFASLLLQERSLGPYRMQQAQMAAANAAAQQHMKKIMDGKTLKI